MGNKQQLQLNNETLASILSNVLGLPSQESLKHGAYVWKKYLLNNRLPSGYKELEYIQGTGTQYFNTGVAPNANTVIEIDFGDLVLPSSTDYAVLGSAWGNYSVLYNATNRIKWYASGGGNTTQTVISKISLKITSSAITVNGSATSISCSSSYPSKNIWLFNTGDNGAGTYYLGRFKLYALKIYNGLTLIRDYVPAKNSNGEVGLYDLVNNTFGKSSGSGEFVAGEEIIKGDWVDYVVSDNSTDYPDGGMQDGYWYEKVVQEIVGIDFGEVALASEEQTVTISHNLGDVPFWVALIPKELSLFSEDNWNTILKINNQIFYNEGSGFIQRQISGVPENILTTTEVTFKSLDSSHQFPAISYYWFAIA